MIMAYVANIVPMPLTIVIVMFTRMIPYFNHRNALKDIEGNMKSNTLTL